MNERRTWTADEDALLRSRYDGTSASKDALAATLGRTRFSVTGRISVLHLAKVSHRDWTAEELDWLHDHWGVLPDETICEHLGRTKAACILAVRRHLHIRRKMSFYSAYELMRILGLKESKTITRTWLRKGFIKGQHSHVPCGNNRMWFFTEANVEDCLRRRPWLVDLERLEDHNHFCSIVRAEYERDPWYTVEQAAPLLGVRSANAVHRCITGGLLKAEKKPGGPWQGVWIIRKSAIDAMLADDVRPGLKKQRMVATRKENNYDKGVASLAARLWVMRCPRCRQTVRILSGVRATNAQVGSWFLATYAGECNHGAETMMKEVEWLKIEKAPNEITKSSLSPTVKAA